MFTPIGGSTACRSSWNCTIAATAGRKDTNNFQDAMKYLEKMKKKNIIVTPYLDAHIVEEIYKGCGIAMPQNNDVMDGDDVVRIEGTRNMPRESFPSYG